jgi:hypothetical protein
MTEDEFQRQLSELLRAAVAGGVDVRGGWACQSDRDDVDWDVEIVEVARDHHRQSL